MSEQKMRDALITAREALVLEGYAEDNLAVVKIDEALAQQPAAEMDCKCSLRTKLAGDGCEVCNPERHEDSAVVELPYKWTGCADADTALILIGRIDAPDDQVRLDQLEQLVLNMGNSIAKQSGGGA